ncbi:MAG: HPr(Ser) kinase/phosphatase [Oscillospiraceae bacterium]|nr:HPr(Ser) kinase/phosphatase [Clostridiaceae bacterium]MDO4495890.1 HPr(Ser) kinase/phosphatase [Clostridiaceae bacterium]MDY5947786.1 HPr(Ser) kinase/phosphatase [Oscillospiraceae bacterium]
MSKYSVSLEKVVNDLSLQVVYTPKSISDIYITSQDVNRPGLILTGFEDYFDPERIQFLGLTELEYIKSLAKDEVSVCAERFLSKKPAALIVTRGLECGEIMLNLAQKYEVPVLSTNESTSGCMSATISYLGVELAQRITRHGVLVEVYGEGVLILGDSGVGKSETALELIKRGHRLIADDAVEIRRVSNRTLVGSAPDNIRHFIELRGVGVLNARRLFGMGAVKMTEKVDMVVQLEPWNSEKVYDRLGLENEYTEILGIKVPVTVVPVKPGRNLSIIIEAAAMNNRQKKMGYNAARELLHSLGMTDDIIPAKKELEFWHNF